MSFSLPVCLVLSIPLSSFGFSFLFFCVRLSSFFFCRSSMFFRLFLCLSGLFIIIISTFYGRCSMFFSPARRLLLYVSFSCYDRFLPSSCTDAYTPSSSPSPSSHRLSAPTRSQNPNSSNLTPPHTPSPNPFNIHPKISSHSLTFLHPKIQKYSFLPLTQSLNHPITQSHISRAPRVAPPSSRVPDSPTLRSRLWRTKRRRDGGVGL